jgi:hypothetical protein
MKISPFRSSIVSAGFVAVLALAARPAHADLELPRPSPFAKVWQTVGLTEISVDYSSPGVKGRKIWGGLVPYDQMWRAGANTATKVTFSKPVTFAGKPVPAGTYAFFLIPGKDTWTVILNKKVDQSGTGRDYKQAEDLLRVSVKPKAAPFRERLAYLVTDFTDDKASLDLEWEKLRLSIPITVETGTQALANIKAAVDGTWRTYANAARYMLENKKDYDTGMTYVDQSLALKQDWYNLWIKAQLLSAKGAKKDALATGERVDLPDVLRGADLFLLPSETESFGLAALEAMACGVPVIASRVGGLPEVIVDGVTGFLPPAGDLDAMARAAIELLADDERASRMALAARQHAEAHFRPEPVVDRYLEVYARALARG